MNIKYYNNFYIFIFLLFISSGCGQYNEHECDHMQEPKLLRSCCKIPHTNDVIRKCRRKLLNEKSNGKPTAAAKLMREDKVQLHICIAECEFKMKNYSTVPYEINMAVVEADLRKEHTDDMEYVELLLAGFHKCLDYAHNKTKELAWMQSENTCNIFPATLLACAIEHVYEKCPPKKWHKTKECEKMRSFLIKCDQLKSN